MNSKYLAKQKLPDKPGVYIFRDFKNRPIYIGRATSLRDRTKSYFANDLISTRGARIVDMVTKSKSISWEEAGSVLEAILLESALIKKYQPYYNIDERDDKSGQYVIITDEPWPRVFLKRVRDIEQMETDQNLPFKVGRKFGPFMDGGLIRESLRILRKMFPFRDFKANDPRHESFYRSIGRSPDTDEGEEDRLNYLKNIKYLTLFFEGKGKKLRLDIEKDMYHYAEEKKFELADSAKKLLYTLDHINDIALIKKARDNNLSEHKFRMEAFDVAHLSGTNVVGVMVVSVNGSLERSEYRRFKISIEKNDDLAGLGEIVNRRLNHPEWSYPELIVVDGDERQYKKVCNMLSIRRLGISVVAVTKDERHKAVDFVGNPNIIEKYKTDIVALNAEAHRFAVKYHRVRRKKSFGI